jgi:hypothetical protein
MLLISYYLISFVYVAVSSLFLLSYFNDVGVAEAAPAASGAGEGGRLSAAVAGAAAGVVATPAADNSEVTESVALFVR